MHPNPRKLIPVLLIVVLAGVVWWYFGTGQGQTQDGQISASGTIEATQISLAPEVGGKVVEITANKGNLVEPGQVLIRFEDALMQAQLERLCPNPNKVLRHTTKCSDWCGTGQLRPVELGNPGPV